MARPIKETPIITGKDAKRFRETMENIKPVTIKRIEEINQSYELAKSHATFYMP
jgi:hypothetical protein